MTTINNTAPNVMTLRSTEVGFTKIRFTHTTPVDLDVSKRSAWVKVQGQPDNTVVRKDEDYEGLDYFYISDLTAGTIYDLKLSHVDEIVAASEPLLDAQYSNETSLTLLELLGVTTKTPVSITNVTNNISSQEIGAPPSTVTIELTGEASSIVIEATPTGTGQWEVIYSGSSAAKVNVTMAAGSYDFRVTSRFVFSDNTVDPGGTVVYGSIVEVGGSVADPNAATNLVFAAFKELDTSSIYNLLLTWDYDGTGGGPKRHYNIYYKPINSGDDPALVDYSDATVVVAVGESYAFTNFPFRKHYAFKVEVTGWNNNLSAPLTGKTYVTDVSEAIAHQVIATVGSYSPDTKVQIDNRYIRGYKEYNSPVDNVNTFEFDAATGNVTIGAAGVYGPNNTNVTTPFLFDAANARLAIAGQTITDEIISASYVMGWISGETPEFRTANKTQYADGTSGIWMGYEGANVTDFKMDIGDGTQYMRWDGSKLIISGSVVITDSQGAEVGDIASIASAGSVPVSIYREDSNYYNTGAISNAISGTTLGTALEFPDVTRGAAEAVTISIKLSGAGGDAVHVALNDVDLGATSGGTEGDRWYHFQGTSVSGTNSVKIWDTGSDSVTLRNLVVTYGTPSNASSTPAGWETVKPADITTPTVISTANVSAGSVLGDWSVPTTLNAIDGVDGNKGNYLDYVYKVEATQPTKPADYDTDPAGWNPDIPIYNQNDVVWVSQATRDGTGLIIIPWSTPTRWNAFNGEDGNPGPGFYSQSFPYINTSAQNITWAAASGDTQTSHDAATDYFLQFFNRAPSEHEVITQYDGNDASDSITMMYQSGVWTTATATVHGDMIVDGSVRVQTLIADNLSAIRADLGNVTAGSIRLSDTTTSNMSLDMVFNDVNVDTVFDFTDKNDVQAFQLSASDWTNNYFKGRIGKDSINSTQALTVETRKALNPYYLGDVDSAAIQKTLDVASGTQLNTTDNTNEALRSVTTANTSMEVQVDARIEKRIELGVEQAESGYKTPKWTIQLYKRINGGAWITLGPATEYIGSSRSYSNKEGPLITGWTGYSSIKTTHSVADTIYAGEVVEYGVIPTRTDGQSSGTIVLAVDTELEANVLAFKENEIQAAQDGYFVDKDTGFCVQWGVTNTAGANTLSNSVTFPRAFTTVFNVVGSSKESHKDADSCHPTNWTNTGFTWVNGAGTNNQLSWIAIGII